MGRDPCISAASDLPGTKDRADQPDGSPQVEEVGARDRNTGNLELRVSGEGEAFDLFGSKLRALHEVAEPHSAEESAQQSFHGHGVIVEDADRPSQLMHQYTDFLP